MSSKTCDFSTRSASFDATPCLTFDIVNIFKAQTNAIKTNPMHKFLSAIALAASIVIATAAAAQKKDVTLADLMEKGTFRAKTVAGLTSMKDGVNYTAVAGGDIVAFSYQTGKAVDTVLSHKTLEKLGLSSFSSYEFSNDETQLLLVNVKEPVYRRSYTASYYIYNRSDKSLKPVSSKGKQSYATFSPDGKKVAFVRGNNLFFTVIATGEEVQVTNDGKFNSIINGSTDWVYEEEFGFVKGFEWSPDSKRIAYYRFDESRVKLFNMTKFENHLYPENYAYKYPKAGEQNSVVSIFCYGIDSKESVKMNVGDEDNQYIARIVWSNDPQKLAMIRLNRLQNQLDILLGNAADGTTSTLYTEKNTKYITEVTDSYLTFLDNGKELIINSEKDGYNHLYLLDMNGKQIRQLTKGSWDVTDFIGVDQKSRLAYFIAAGKSPLQRELYTSSLKDGSIKMLSAKLGTNKCSFSSGFKYYINFYSSSSDPTEITLHQSNGKLIRVLEANNELKQKLNEYSIINKEFFKFTTPEGVELNGWMMKPASFDPNKKYPVLMTQYSGPGSQEVLDSWELGWEQVLAQKGYLVVCVDGRGTGARGEAFKKQTYGQLGKYEVQDQISAARYIGSLPYADKDRVAIWGWSFGGFMSLNCILQGADVFKLAIAVAPVTNWRYYDSVYTERFNGLPQDNPSGYDSNSPINYVHMLKGKLLLVHGSADDNVHIQNTFELVSKLIQHNKQYDMMVYPDKNHSIYGGKTRLQLFTKFIDYLDKNL